METVVIMQPNFFPWVGLFEQIRQADVFVHLDDTQFSKGGYVNRVRVGTVNGPKWLTVPLSDLKLGDAIREVKICYKENWQNSHLELLKQSQKKAPYFNEMIRLVETIYNRKDETVADLDIAAIELVTNYLNINPDVRFVRASALGVEGMGSQRVLNLVKHFGGLRYVTGHGARNYLDHEAFERAGVKVEYMNYRRTPWPQLHGNFDPHNSVLELLANTGNRADEYINSSTISWKKFINT